MRAKYDGNVKQDLEAQLALGRELTQKNQQSDSSDSEDDDGKAAGAKSGNGNPWLDRQPSDDLGEAFSGYKKFWEEHNANEKATKKIKQAIKKVKEEKIAEVPQRESSDEEEEEDESDIDEASSLSENEDSSKFINDLFDEAEEKISHRMESKLSELKPKLLEIEREKKGLRKKKRGANARDANYLGFVKKAKLGDVDEALNEGDVEEETVHIPSKRLLNEIKAKKAEKEKFMKGSNDIDPESFLSVKSKHLITAIPKSQDLDEVDDEFEVNQLSKANKMSLAEAFESDDIINDFTEEVETEAKKNAATDDATTLPGWGNWGGHGVKAPNPKFFKKVPEVKRKDRIIISSATNEKLQKHLVSTVPFPFKSVQDFEASMRLPIGRDFIPESAHRKLTLPSIVTKAGTIIEPMTEDILVQKGPPVKIMKKGKKVRKGRK